VPGSLGYALHGINAETGVLGVQHLDGATSDQQAAGDRGSNFHDAFDASLFLGPAFKSAQA